MAALRREQRWVCCGRHGGGSQVLRPARPRRGLRPPSTPYSAVHGALHGERVERLIALDCGAQHMAGLDGAVARRPQPRPPAACPATTRAPGMRPGCSLLPLNCPAAGPATFSRLTTCDPDALRPARRALLRQRVLRFGKLGGYKLYNLCYTVVSQKCSRENQQGAKSAPHLHHQ